MKKKGSFNRLVIFTIAATMCMTGFAVLPTSSAVNAGPIPHPLYVNVQNDVGVSPPVGDLTFSAWLTKDPSSILTESSYGCFYIVPPGCGIECGNFATAWYAGDVVHIEVEQTSTGYVGTGEFTLTNDNYQVFTGINGIIIAPLLPPPSEVWVDDGYYDGGTNDGHAWGYDAFATIQEGVDAVSGSTVHVAPGTYSGAVVDKQVNIIGASGGSSIITSGVPYKAPTHALTTAFRLDSGADGTEITDFTINCGASFYFAVFSRGVDEGITNWGGNNWEITNNVLTDTVAAGGGGIGIFLGATPPTYRECSENLVQYNTIYADGTEAGYTSPGMCLCIDVRYGAYGDLDGSEDVTNNRILDNTILGTGNANEVGIEVGVIGLLGDLTKIAYTMGMVHDNYVQDNTVDGSDYGIYAYVVEDLAIEGNEIKNCITHGISIWDDFTGNINCNKIYDNAYGLYNDITSTVDAECNWWGDCSGPTHASNPGGTGEVVSDNVDFDPWIGIVVAIAGGPYEDDDCDYTVTFDGSSSSVSCTCGGETLTYSWDFGDGHTGTDVNPTHTYTTFDEYTVTLTVTGSVYGSTDTDTATVKIYGAIAEANGPYEDDDCDYTVTFDGSGSSGYEMPLTYDWDFGDGTGWHNGLGATPSCTYSDFGEYTVKLRVTESGNDCSDTDTATVKIYGVIAEANGPYSTEDLNPIQFDSSGSHGYLEPLSYLWDFGDGETSTLENPTHIYTQVGEYTVTLTVTESGTSHCFDVDTATVIVTSTVTADAHGSYEGIVGIPVDFVGSAADGVLPYSWYWSFGDSVYSPTQNPSHIYDETGTYTVSLKVTDDIDGYDTDATTVVIYPPEVVVADAGGPYSGGVGQVIAFTGSAVGGVSPYTFEWDLDNDGFYDDATGQSASKSWSTIGTYTIGLKVTDNIGTTDTDTAQVSITSQAPNKPSKPSGSTSGKAGEEYTYTSSTTDPDDDDVFYLFDWDDGTDSGWLGPHNSGDTVTASHTWTDQGNYQIKVKAKDTSGVESDWSDPLAISMPKNKAINPFMLFLERLMERFPILEQILQPILVKLAGF